MKKLAGTLMIVAFASGSAFGGTVEFLNPSSGGSILELTTNGAGTFDVWITESSNNPFNSVDIVFASDDLYFDAGAWTFSEAFTDATHVWATSNTPNQIPGVRDEFKVGGVNLSGNVIPLPIMVGTLTIIAPVNLGPGDYNVFVDASLETNGVSKVSAIGADPDPLFGLGRVLVPEPTTLVLLGTGTVVALRRRRQTA